MTTGLPRLAECRDCHDPIRFVRMDTTGRALPVDPAPNPERGTVAATLRAGSLVGFVISRDRQAGVGHPYRFTPHHATCEARKPAPKQTPAPTPTLF